MAISKEDELKLLSSKSLGIVLLIGVLAATGWITYRTTTPGGSSACGCDTGATCPATPDSSKAVVDAAVPQGKSGAKKPVAEPTGLPRIVDLGSTTCIPCKMMTPVLEDLSKTCKGKLAVEFINIVENPKVTEKYKVRVIPTQVLYDKNGHEFFRHVGFYPKEDILAKFKEHGIDLGKVGAND